MKFSRLLAANEAAFHARHEPINSNPKREAYQFLLGLLTIKGINEAIQKDRDFTIQ
jgi:hypothetical protein